MSEQAFPISLAKKAIEEYLQEKKVIPTPQSIPKEFQGRAGVFVSLHKKGKLRGCIGTYFPVKENIAREIIRNAISAATQDPRFPPVEVNELKDIEMSVDILSRPEPVRSTEELDPKKYGVIVSKGWQKGLLLPDLDGVNTIRGQLDIVKQKAGLWGVPDEELEIQQFTVTRYKETH